MHQDINNLQLEIHKSREKIILRDDNMIAHRIEFKKKQKRKAFSSKKTH